MTSEEKTKMHLGLKIAIFITAIQVWRVTAIAFLGQVGDTLPEFWGIAFRGDTFIAVTALPVALMLLKFRNLKVWTIGVIWQSIGLADLYVALESQFLHPVADASYVIIPAGMVMHALALYLILKNRRHYFEVK